MGLEVKNSDLLYHKKDTHFEKQCRRVDAQNDMRDNMQTARYQPR